MNPLIINYNIFHFIFNHITKSINKLNPSHLFHKIVKISIFHSPISIISLLTNQYSKYYFQTNQLSSIYLKKYKKLFNLINKKYYYTKTYIAIKNIRISLQLRNKISN